MTTYAPPTESDLLTIADQVWTSYLDLDGASPLLAFPADTPANEVSASVSVTGAWQGHVVLTCSDLAARHIGAALLSIELGEVTDADIADALGELANIIGGNVKSLLPEPCALSLPHVVTGATMWPSVAAVCRLSGIWLGEPVSVCVLESNAGYAGVPS
jgi:chemotaxis protein CheX